MTKKEKWRRGQRKIKEKEKRKRKKKNIIKNPSFAEVQCASAKPQLKRNAQIIILLLMARLDLAAMLVILMKLKKSHSR